MIDQKYYLTQEREKYERISVSDSSVSAKGCAERLWWAAEPKQFSKKLLL